MELMRRRLALSALCLVVALAACGESSTDGADGTSEGDDQICSALGTIRDFDVESAGLIAEVTTYREVADFFAARTPDVLDAYDEAIAVADEDLVEDLEVLRAFAEGFAAAAEGVDSIEELQAEVFAGPEATEAGRAALSLNTYAQETCGFSTGGN